jgi:hypothetical protein
LINQNDFFAILKFLKEDASEDVPEEVRNIAKNTKLRTQDFFTKVIDQVPFNSSDYNRLRKLLIDWYSSLATFQDLEKSSSDAFTLPHKLLNISCRGFGFPYADGIGSRVDKALFLYSLTELYKIKGSPKSIKSALEFFGVYDVQIFEWWIKNDPILDSLFIHSKPVDLGGVNIEALEVQKIPYNHFTFDNHWWYSQEQIQAKNNELPINLPSITPYFSIQASANIQKLVQLYGIISRKISDTYTDFHDNGIALDRSIFVNEYNESLSLLEIILSISHLYNTWSNRTTGSSSIDYEHYRGDTEDFDVIIDEYNQVISRPNTRQQMMDLQAEYTAKFTKLQANNFIPDRATVEAILSEINSPFKIWLDNVTAGGEDRIVNVLQQFLKELDIYIRMEYGIQALSFSNMVLGIDNDDIGDVINFFKPKRSRLLAFNLVYAINDPLMHSIVMAESLGVNITQWKTETYDNLRDALNNPKWQNDGVSIDFPGTIITQWDYDYYNCASSLWSCISDATLITPIQYKIDIFSTQDELNYINSRFYFNEYGHSCLMAFNGIFDDDYHFDKLSQVCDNIIINSTINFSDITFRCRENDYDPCGIPGWPYSDRSKTFDSGYIFDLNGFPCDKTFDSGSIFDDPTSDWWGECDDNEKICICETTNTSIYEQPSAESITVTESLGVDNIIQRKTEIYNFLRDEILTRIFMRFSDSLKTEIYDKFDKGTIFDYVRDSLYDHYTTTLLQYCDTTAETVKVTDTASSEIEIQFVDVAGGGQLRIFDNGWYFDDLRDFWRDDMAITVTDGSGIVPLSQWYMP